MSIALVLSMMAIAMGAVACIVFLREQARLGRVVDALKAENLELQRTLERQAVFANEIAHELKNPITAIVCAADTLELILDADLSEDNRKTLRYIHNYGEHILQMMQDFIELTRGQCGMLRSSPTLVRIAEAALSVVGLLGPSAGCRGIDLQLEGYDSPACGYVDAKHLKQIIFNLVHNSVKFTPSGGGVVVRVDRNDDVVIVEVSDTGPGLGEQRLRQLLDPIDPAHCAIGESTTGHGIGLTLVKTLVVLERGSLKVRSEPVLGTTIRVEFPVVMPLPVAEPVPQTGLAQSRPLEGQSVLVVDQDPGVRDTVARLVEALGGVVDGVSLAAEAIAALNRSAYSVVVLDESLEGLSGSVLLAKLHDETSAPRARIVITSARSAKQVADNGIVADYFVEKPLDRKALIESILQAH